MTLQRNKDIDKRFLKSLSRIKGWKYHDKIEQEKKSEIKEFIVQYIFKNVFGEILQHKISYNRINFLISHPGYKPFFNALLLLLESSTNETEFNELYLKATR